MAANRVCKGSAWAVLLCGGPLCAKTELRKEFCLTLSHFFTPNFQLLGEVRHEFVNVGGQRQNVGTLLRALYLF